MLLLAIVMGVVITLDTTAGQLVIETASPDVEVRLLKAGKPYQTLMLKQQARSLRLGAGEYEIEIISDSDGLEIENGRYTLKRGETWLAKIVHRSRDAETQETANLSASDDQRRLSLGKPTYEGRTLQQWLGTLRTERSPQQYYEACRALTKLATGQDAADAVRALLVATRFHDSVAHYQGEDGGFNRLWSTGQTFLADLDQTVVVQVMTDELDRGDGANVEFILSYLASWDVNVRPFVSENLLAHVERIAMDEQSPFRIHALNVLQKIGSREAATRQFVAALSDPEIASSVVRRSVVDRNEIECAASGCEIASTCSLGNAGAASRGGMAIG